jgi:signal transduction histidine kinase
MTKLRSFLTLDGFAKTLAEYDLAAKQHLRLFKITSLFGFFVIAILLWQLSLIDSPPRVFLIIIISLFFALFVNYFALAFHKNSKLSFSLLLLLSFGLLHICSYAQGGIRNSGLLYLASLILVAFLMLGKTGGITMALVSLAHIIYFYILSLYTDWVDYSLIGTEPGLIDFDFLLSGIISTLLLSALANFIEKSKAAIIEDIMSKKNQLAANNERLLRSEEALNRINRQYARKNNELELKNKELAEFNFVAAHDLQEPLSTTATFVELLQKQYHHQLDEKGAKYLEYIAHASTRMQVLITDLIDYSNIGSVGELKKIDCNNLLDDVLSDLSPNILESKAKITATPLPAIKGYETDIKLLFHSLLCNAIKFRRKEVEPMINVSVARKDDNWVFAITDNGIGIAEEHAARIFSIFQRLHTRNRYEGSGIGLSHCKKIIRLHKGDIWLDSVPGQGSTFYFTLPVLREAV